MPEAPAINASPLIFLARAGLMDLLKLIGEKIVVPRAVADEILRRGKEDITARAVESIPWLQIVETDPVPPTIQSWGLGQGESTVLTWGYTNPGAEVIIDDLAARRCAAALGIPVRGTLGLVLKAKALGAIPAARPVVEHLRVSGMYLSDTVVDNALRFVGE